MFADELVGREAFEGLQPAPEVVGADEVGEVISQRVVVIVVEAFDGRFLDRAVPLPGNGLPANRERGSAQCGACRARRRSGCVRQRGGGHFPGLSVQFHESKLGDAVPSRAFSMPCQAMDGTKRYNQSPGKPLRKSIDPPDQLLLLAPGRFADPPHTSAV